jgi:hypothetical protein
VTTVRAFAEELRFQATRGDLDGALLRVGDFVLDVLGRDSAMARVFSSRELDALCLELGALTEASAPGGVDPGQSVFLVTGVQPTGGHTRVLLDLIVADAAARATVLITNFHQGLTPEAVAEILVPANVRFELAPVGAPSESLKWMQGRLSALRPARTYILQHHFDPICVAAVQPHLVDRLFYFHNCDHSLALGVHLPHATHVDFNAKSYYHCREVEGVADNTVWPLTVDDLGVPKRVFADGEPLTSCCCGGYEKFEQPHMAESIPYAIAYEEVVGSILLATGGRHVHVGPLSDGMLARISAVLDRTGISQARFVHVPYAPELTQALVDHRVDVFVGSAPRGGGRAMVEAMAVGLPMLVHSNYRTIFFSAENDVYEGAMIWRTLTDLVDHLVSLDAEKRSWHAQVSRRFYEANHHPGLLKAAVAATLAGRAGVVPRRPVHVGDALQAYLDEQRVRGPGPPPAEAAAPSHMPSYAQAGWRISTKDLVRLVGWRILNKFKAIAGPS